MSKQLTPKQEKFIDEYLVDLNATKAYMRAYEVQNEESARRLGSKLLTNVDISMRIEERRKELSKKTQLTQEWVLQKLEECVKKSMQEEEIQKWDYENKCMTGTGEYIYDSKGATKALELIGKHLGMYKDKLELSGELDVNITIGDDE